LRRAAPRGGRHPGEGRRAAVVHPHGHRAVQGAAVDRVPAGAAPHLDRQGPAVRAAGDGIQLTTEASAGAGAGAGVTIGRTVEWQDTDAAGHYHHSAVIRWVEAAETALHERLGLTELM